MKMWMVNLSRNLLPCDFQNLRLHCDQLLFGPRCDGLVLRGKRGEEDLRGSYFQRAWLLGPGFLLLGGWGIQHTLTKKKKKKEGRTRKPRVEAGEVERTPLPVQL